ncbi:MAG TPA: hypothetical protein RMH85_23205 [Polyangiaceae bacterium LLY-WYZ-15_(1-7)]|nr:hypothetical protein [Polyangiaceae bacterium LLY-WYZ-15_(1-7)]HJK99877.1 hypothetical protein [Polyangiaceae bacterium LLY-WYZ-15_(1-7)]HJL11403.1 hypothetical protein [Polyangiaceae bacterium LLY-WYZ-15_(1-7)]
MSDAATSDTSASDTSASDTAANDSATNDSASNDSATSDSAANDSAANDSAASDTTANDSATSDSTTSDSAANDMTAGGTVEWDDSEFPFVRCRMAGRLTRAHVPAYLEGLDRQLDRAAPFVILWDVRQLAFPEPWALRVAGEHQRRRVADFRAHLRGEAHVITSPFIRAAVRMVNWFQPAPQPQAYFRTGAEAERWLREQLGVYAATGSG